MSKRTLVFLFTLFLCLLATALGLIVEVDRAAALPPRATITPGATPGPSWPPQPTLPPAYPPVVLTGLIK